MNLILDIGNSRTKYFAFEKGESIAEAVEEGHELALMDTFVSGKTFEKGIVGSVVDLDKTAEQRLQALPFPVLRMSGQTPTPIVNGYRTPETLGCDRLAAAVGAWCMHPKRPLLIIDAGSCITFDFVDAQGKYLGGNIAPGIPARLQAIDANFPRLPLVDEAGIVPEIGFDTVTAIRAGVVEGVRFEIEGYIAHFQRQFPDLLVLITGGSNIKIDKTREDILFADHFMVARGLDRILEYQNK